MGFPVADRNHTRPSGPAVRSCGSTGTLNSFASRVSGLNRRIFFSTSSVAKSIFPGPRIRCVGPPLTPLVNSSRHGLAADGLLTTPAIAVAAATGTSATSRSHHFTGVHGAGPAAAAAARRAPAGGGSPQT